MCRITGYWNISNSNPINDLQVITNLRDALAHGGPDAANHYTDVKDGIHLGHRRLSIIDTSEAGTQPMYWNDLVIIYNGEIYNFEEVKKKLSDYTFKTGTDSEVILKAFEKWGYDCVEHFRGMFAFVIWNQKDKKLILCRDRMGVKPLYYYWKDGLFMFSSELKAFHQHPQFEKAVNKEAVSLYLQQGYIPSPHSIFQYCYKLESGHFLEINERGDINKIAFWNIEEVYQKDELTGSEDELTDQLESILSESFKYRMVSDVPVGMFLSGGIDSTLVTALLQKEYDTPLKTFTIGFDDKNVNEANYAKEVAAHIGTDHEELYCNEEIFKNLIPKLPELFDEPLGNGSAIPVYLVSQLAKNEVKVSLSADGGDEIFGGYSKYEIVKKFYNKLNSIPKSGRKLVAAGIGTINTPQRLKKIESLPFFKNYSNLGTKLHKMQKALTADNLLDFFNSSSTYISSKALKEIHPGNITSRLSMNAQVQDDRLLGYLGMADMKTFLEGEVLTTIDRATMAVSLEGREPFLDQNIIEFGLRLNDDLKIKNGKTKYILRKILYKYVPKELIERPKHGFDIPIAQWTRTFLKDDILMIPKDQKFVNDLGFDQEALTNRIKGYYENKDGLESHFVWFLYVLHKWHNRWMAGE